MGALAGIGTYAQKFKVYKRPSKKPPYLREAVHVSQNKNLCFSSLPLPIANTKLVGSGRESCIPLTTLDEPMNEQFISLPMLQHNRVRTWDDK